MDVSRWVDDRLSSLDPPGNWRPDSSAAIGEVATARCLGGCPGPSVLAVGHAIRYRRGGVCGLLLRSPPHRHAPIRWAVRNPSSPRHPRLGPWRRQNRGRLRRWLGLIAAYLPANLTLRKPDPPRRRSLVTIQRLRMSPLRRLPSGVEFKTRLRQTLKQLSD